MNLEDIIDVFKGFNEVNECMQNVNYEQLRERALKLGLSLSEAATLDALNKEYDS